MQSGRIEKSDMGHGGLLCGRTIWALALIGVMGCVRTTQAEADSTPSTMTVGYENGLFLRDAENAFGLRIGGWIQARYEYLRRPDDEDLSSFYIRRLRLDIRGHVLSEDLTFRILQELARDANLQDGWINYAFNPAMELRIGQFTVPFQWHREVGPRRQHFAERGVPSETFGLRGGRDIGVMLHGRNESDTMKYGVGIFDGAGRNVRESNSRGHMASARLALAALGTLPREESDYRFSEQANLAFGLGAQAANRSELRAWDLGRSAGDDPDAEPDVRGDWASVTADARFAYRGFSLVADGYLRSVDPRAAAVDSYDGWAYMLSAGYFLIPKRLEMAGRYSELRLDSNDADTEQTAWGLGANLYLKGHDWKLRFNYLNRERENGERDDFILVEHHLQF